MSSLLTRAACTAAVALVGWQAFKAARHLVLVFRTYLELPGPDQELLLGNVSQVGTFCATWVLTISHMPQAGQPDV